jgi:hypothetical protein
MLITAALALKQISADQEKVEGPILQTFFIGKKRILTNVQCPWVSREKLQL